MLYNNSNKMGQSTPTTGATHHHISDPPSKYVATVDCYFHSDTIIGNGEALTVVTDGTMETLLPHNDNKNDSATLETNWGIHSQMTITPTLNNEESISFTDNNQLGKRYHLLPIHHNFTPTKTKTLDEEGLTTKFLYLITTSYNNKDRMRSLQIPTQGLSSPKRSLWATTAECCPMTPHKRIFRGL